MALLKVLYILNTHLTENPTGSGAKEDVLERGHLVGGEGGHSYVYHVVTEHTQQWNVSCAQPSSRTEHSVSHSHLAWDGQV